MRLGKKLQQLKGEIERAAEQAPEETEGGTGSVNVAGRVNKAVVANVGRPGSTQAVSSRQKVRIRQNGEESYEESETITTSSATDG